MNEQQQKVSKIKQDIQSRIVEALSKASNDEFSLEAWDYEQGSGGGLTRVVLGDVLEKGGVNYSGINGVMNKEIAPDMKQEPNTPFFATGVSLVIHPKNPFVPTTHMNVRYFQTDQNWWIGGGIDLTPYYFEEEDVKEFHQKIKNTCDRYDSSYYPKFKKWCDDYFYLPHRKETRGLGGIFYDYLNHDLDECLSFNQAVGDCFIDCFVPFINKYKDKPYSAEEKEFQKYRRGRYAEFNLVYDRGTKFGFKTAGRTESILMSLPPEAIWKYNWQPKRGSSEAKLYEYLKPIDWI